MMRTAHSVRQPAARTLVGIDRPQPQRVRVLVVDDMAPFRAAMTAVVEATEGFVVIGAVASGEDAVSATTALRPDLVLMDVNLPGIDGLEATRQIRALTQPPEVLLLSTYDADAAEDYVRQSGAAGYVTKSEFGPERLTTMWAATRRRRPAAPRVSAPRATGDRPTPGS